MCGCSWGLGLSPWEMRAYWKWRKWSQRAVLRGLSDQRVEDLKCGFWEWDSRGRVFWVWVWKCVCWRDFEVKIIIIKRTKNRGISQFSAALFGPSQIYFTLHIPKQLYLLKSLILFLLLIKEFGGVSLGQSFWSRILLNTPELLFSLGI